MKKITWVLALSVNLFASALVSGESPPHHSSIVESVDRFISDLPDEFNGTILLAIGDAVLMNKGYGWANRSFDIPNTPETKYELASVTKDLTTILVFKLVEMGLIDLDATIDTYLPDYPKDKASKITIRHLLLHQSGIRHHFRAIPDFFGFHDRIYHTPRELLKLFWDKDLAHEPGEGTTYTSPGYWLLAIIMETVSGKSFAELLDEHICRPLGMKDTHVDNNLIARKNLAVGYKKGLDGYVADLKEEQLNNLGAGDMISTTGDLYRFQRILSPDNDLVLSRKTKQLLFEEQFRINNWFVRTMVATLAQTPYNDGQDTLRVFGIGTGGNYGFQARLTRLVDHDATYIVLSNTHNDRTMNEQMYNFLQDILCEELGIPLKTYRRLGPLAESEMPAEVPIEHLRLYEGIYRASKNDIIHLFVENGNLSFRGFEKSYWDRIEVRGGQLIPLNESAFLDRNGFVPRYFLFVIPSELTADNPYASLRSFFTDTPDTNRYQLVRTGQGGINRALWWSAEDAPDIDLAGYQGDYYSVELQKTFRFGVNEDHLIAFDFLEGKDVSLVPLEADLFSCDQGFLVFHRYKDGGIRDFWLMSENVDHVYGALFIRK
jgi:CubicO group peptidase (beta-lactamase class C family)